MKEYKRILQGKVKSIYKLSQINIYPVKSLSGLSLKDSIAEERGLKYDRRWMIVDSENTFVTQRLFPHMVFINVKITENLLIFSHRRKPIGELRINLKDIPNKNVQVNVWGDYCNALEYSQEINQWFTEAIKIKCKLVYMPNTTKRKTSTKYFDESKNVSFADGYPYLIIGEESLNLLNSKLEKKVFMTNFRPNLVFSGGNPHDEDNWKFIKIGKLKFAVVKPCARCVIPTIDLQSGNKGKEPLLTLSKYRSVNNKVLFGQNSICLEEGKISIGDTIEVNH